MSKYLLFFLGLGTTAGAATFVSLTSGAKQTQEEKKIEDKKKDLRPESKPGLESSPKQEKPQKNPELGSEIELPSSLKEKINFEGVLVFSRVSENSGQVSKITNVFYKGELLKKLQDQLEKNEEDEEDKEDKEAKIKIFLDSEKAKKSESEIREYIEKLNQKIKAQTKGIGHLEKLKISLKDSQNEFKENFKDEVYDQLLKEIEELQKPAKPS